ncbi:MAG: ATP-binding protein, partial [Acidobacteriota bacterium]
MTEMPSNELSWVAANHHYVLAAVDVVRAHLEHHANRFADDEDRLPDRRAETTDALSAARRALPGRPALDRLVSIFGMSTFERAILLMGVGMETGGHFGLLCAAAQHDERRPYPTFRLALDALPDAHWDALSPDGTLRRWRMVEIEPGPSLASSPLRLSERVLHELLGVESLDERLAGVVEPIPSAEPVAPSHGVLVEQIAGVWETIDNAGAFPTVQLVGIHRTDRRAVATAACARLGRQLKVMSATVIATKPDELEALRRIWELEGALSNSVLLIEVDDLPADDHVRRDAVAWLAEHALGGVILSAVDRQPERLRPLVTLEVGGLPKVEQRALWRSVLEGFLPADETEDGADGIVDRLATQFHLGAPAIRAAGLAAVARHQSDGSSLDDALWQSCRLQARPQLDELAQRIVPRVGMDDLVLPDPHKHLLRQITVHVRQRRQVYEEWGFGGEDGRGQGITALFAGSSGTGKTMAAEVLAAELDLDLYRIDLSAVVSKYIGETEKNLRKIFDAAETGGAILLFDEADALFGKRSDVKDSHDRHANVEVSYLLQRMEAYRGLAILTTNIKSALDKAFLRRLRFIVNFPYPNAEQRAEIWRRVFPPGVPTEDLDYGRLGRLNATGGMIRNIAVCAAFLGAGARSTVTIKDVLMSAQNESVKQDRR